MSGDEDFRIRPGRIRSRGSQRVLPIITQALVAAQRAGGCRPGRGLGKGSGFGEPSECGTKIIQNGLSEGWLYKFSAEHCTGDPRLRFCMFKPCGYNINFVEQANAYSTSIPTLRGRWNIISQRMIFDETDVRF